MDVGLALRQARERRGLTLSQISHSTKISVPVLTAVEAADAAKLPAPVYTRSFVKAYAHEVGLDPDATARRYLAQFEPEETGPPEPDEPAEPARAEQAGVKQAAAAMKWVRNHDRAAIVTAVGVLALLGILAWAGRGAPPLPAQPPAVIAIAAAVPAPAPQPEPVATAGRSPAELHLELAPNGPCWISATADGQPVYTGLLNAGERRKIDSSSDLTLRVGDPSTCAFTLGGKPARVAGAAGVAVTVQITSANQSQFVTRR
jgi:cytoskeletal protein RodZ